MPVKLVSNCAKDLERFLGDDGVAITGSKQFPATTDHCSSALLCSFSREVHCICSSGHKSCKELTLNKAR